jgi:TfoX/Sxy family transcriptional regulator of competence genes
MPYDERLSERIRDLVKRRRGISEQKMFGGLTFLLRGNMFCGVQGRDLMVRVGPEAYERSLARRHAREMDFTGRPLTGLVTVDPAGVRSEAQLRSWVERGIDFTSTLPAKRKR